MTAPQPDPPTPFPAAQASALREQLLEADYTVDRVAERIGAPSHAALGRNQTVPAEQALGEARDPLATLIRLWPLQRSVPVAAVTAALGDHVAPLVAAGVLAVAGDRVQALQDVRPYAWTDDAAHNGYVVADLTPGLDGRIDRMGGDYVLGVSSASTSLTQLAVRRPVGAALDLGTGCGVQAIHLAAHADRVVATDVNRRALAATALTCALNDVSVELREGSLYEPVADERFDLIISNPPYVMAPPDRAALTYREGGFRGDGLVREVVQGAVTRLAPDGLLQVLGNWAHPADGDWAERLAGWVAGTGCDLHVVEREVLDPTEYVELWLADAGLIDSDEYRHRYVEWLDYLAAEGIAAIGMGWIMVRRSEVDTPDVTVESWPYTVEQPIGPALAARADAVAKLRDVRDVDLLDRRFALADDVVQETTGRPGIADPEHIVLRGQRGFRRATEVDTMLGAVVGACDGELELGRIIGAAAGLLDTDATAAAAAVLPRIRELVLDGLLLTAD